MPEVPANQVIHPMSRSYSKVQSVTLEILNHDAGVQVLSSQNVRVSCDRKDLETCDEPDQLVAQARLTNCS